MAEKEVRSKEEVINAVREAISIKELTVNEVEVACRMSISSIGRWEKSSPRTNSVLYVLKFLGYQVLLCTDYELKVYREKDIIDFIFREVKRKKVVISSMLKKLKISKVALYNWRNETAASNIDSILKILNFLEIKVVLRNNQLEDNYDENANEEIENVRESDMDILIKESVNKILKSCNSLHEKEILYKVLQAFL